MGSDLTELCRARGVKLTPQRIAIFEAMEAHPGHPSAEEIFQQVLSRYPSLSFATVYNTLQLLTGLGVVREVIVDELRRRYDLNTDVHAHAVCRQCRRIVDVSPQPAAEVWPAGGALAGYDFIVEAVTVEYSGLCGPCSRLERPTPPGVATHRSSRAGSTARE